MSHDPCTLTTSDGVTLEAELARPDDELRAGAVVAHPHPLYGGDLHAPVVAALFEALPDAGVAALRFNFRGVGRSGGVHDGGKSERLDVLAALDALADAAPGVPLVLAGWSFGADVSAGIDDQRVAGWFLVAAPLSVAPADPAAGRDDRPTLLAVPEHDQFRAPAAAEGATSGWRNTRIEVIRSADHFLAGATGRVAALAVDFVETLAPLSPPR